MLSEVSTDTCSLNIYDSQLFAVNVILIVGHEKLNVEMQRTYGKYITVVKIPKSGGVCLFTRVVYVQWFTSLLQVAERDGLYRLRVHKYQMHSYFYGERFSPPPGMPPLTAGAASTGYIIGGEQNTDLALSPSSAIIAFDDLTIWRIGEGTLWHLTCDHPHAC